MKKIIVAFVATALAVCANAASVKWNTGSAVYQSGDNTAVAADYLITFISSSDYALTEATSDIQDGKLDFVATHGVAEKVTSSTGKASNTISSTAGNSETWTGYLLVFDAATVADATHVFVTAEVTGTTGASGQAATLKFDMDGTQTASNWYAVPEPTTGLLLLLGMAGLALKRKVA